jgi:outer membrane protein assembly factor BamB
MVQLSGSVVRAGARWPQFRGPAGSGVADGGTLPAQFGTSEQVVWKTALPPGHSSPCIWDDRIFLTAIDGDKLEIICLDRRSGRIEWRKAAPAERIENVHSIGSPAAPTPTTDGKHLFVYFGSYGLLCYDLDGHEIWKKPLPIPITGDFGAGTSPVLAGDRVILNCDQDHGSFVMAVDKKTGQTAWKQDRAGFPRGFATPFVWRHDDVEELVVAGTLRIKSYNLADGSERWTVRGLSRIVCPTPTAGNGLLFVAGWAPGGDPGSRVIIPPFAGFAAEHDTDADGKLSKAEWPDDGGAISRRWKHFDGDKNGTVTRVEWDHMAGIFAEARNVLLAIRPNGKGDITDTHVAWTYTRALPYVPSPLVHDGHVYLVKNGGIVTCLDARNGEKRFEGRLGALGEYYASPVAGDGKVYLASQSGTVVVLAAGTTLDVIARNDLGEPIMATPAIVDGKLYVRTEGHLYAFGQ